MIGITILTKSNKLPSGFCQKNKFHDSWATNSIKEINKHLEKRRFYGVISSKLPLALRQMPVATSMPLPIAEMFSK